MNLRTRLVALALLATLLPSVLVAWRFIGENEAEVASAVRELSNAADTLASDLDRRIQGTSQLHYGLALARVLDGADRAACSDYLSAVREAYPQYTGILTVLPDGQLHCDSLRTGRQLDLRDRGYFKRAAAGEKGLILEPVFGRLTGNAVLQIVHPARNDDGALRFLLVASFNLQSFVQNSHIQLHQSTPDVLLLDRQGIVMGAFGARPGLPTLGASLADNALLALARRNESGGTGEVPGADGKAQVWAVTATPTLREAGLQVLVGLPRQELAAEASQRLRQDLLVVAAAALLLFTGVWLLAEWGIRRPVSRITTMVSALGSGQLGARIATPYPRGELGDLMALLNESAAALEQQRDALEELGQRLLQAQKLEAVGTMAGGIAHDFNNIVGAILGNLSLAEEEVARSADASASLEQIRRAALRARDLVQRIRSFSASDKPALLRQDLRPIVEEVVSLVKVTLPAGVTLHTALETLPAPVLADATQLHQVLMNLCTNAWQALQGEAGTVELGMQPVHLDATIEPRPAGLPPGDYAHLWVSDNGCGIDAAQLSRIFEPYYTTKSSRGGTGLGLSVVRGIVHAHHGAIVVDSQPGRGSTFSVYLPLLATPDEAAASGQEKTLPLPGRADRADHELHVCYIDDDEVMTLMIERLLARAGYRVSTYLSAHAALAALRADAQACDLVVTDFNMPEQSGLDLAREVAAFRPELPVIIMSGYIAEGLPQDAEAAGVRAVIRKEAVLEDLLPAIRRVFAASVEPAET